VERNEWDHLPTIEFALILHRLKFIDGMLRRLLRPRPRARFEYPPRFVSFPERPRGRNDPSPCFSTSCHTPHRRTLDLFVPHYRLPVSFLSLSSDPYTFFTFVMFLANSSSNFPNKIRVPTVQSSSYVHCCARLILLKRKCFQKYANVLTRCSDFGGFDGTKIFWFSGRELKDMILQTRDQSFCVIYKRKTPIKMK